MYTDMEPTPAALSLSTFPALDRQRIVAVVVAALLTLAALAVIPSAHRALEPSAPFLPVFVTFTALTDILTAYLLLRDAGLNGSRALTFLGCGYLYTGLIVIAQALTFPGVFSATGLLGAGPQTAIWIWVLWHGGFPIFVLAYITAARAGGSAATGSVRERLLLAGGTIALVAGLVALVTVRQDLFPPLVVNGDYHALIASGIGPAIVLLLLAAAGLTTYVWRGRTVVQLWLAVATYGMLLDVVVTLVGGARFSLGWYAARLISLVAASVVLGALLSETGRLIGIVTGAEKRLRTIVDGVGDALFSIDAAYRLVEANPAARELFGFGNGRVAGTPIDELIPGYRHLVATAGGQRGSARLEVDARKRNGRIFPLELGFTESGVLIGRDITQRRRAEAAIHAARDRAIEAANVKAQFLATMSHEIRTPINAVVGMSELLLQTPLSDEARDYAMTVRDSADSLLAVINDILDFSKIEAGKVALETLPFSIVSAIENTGDILGATARKKGLSLVTFIAPDVPRYVIGDVDRLRQVLLNLVGNAIKFTAFGYVAIRSTVVRAGEDRTHVRIAVSDTGQGMDPAQSALLFQPFQQADGSTHRKFGGTGLGLSISKRLVELMGGTIGLESTPGEGSTFWVEIPFERADDDLTIVSPTLRGRRVLLVENDNVTRGVIDQYLLAWGAVATATATPIHALELLRSAALRGALFDAAILGNDVGGTDAFALALRIRAEPALATIPLIMLSSVDEPGRAAEALARGFRAYLRKPIRQSSLFDALASATSDELPAAGEPLAPAEAPLGRPEVRILIAEDHPVNRKLALQQLKKLGYTADIAVDGREAIESATRERYDLIFMDCQMPEFDGFEATRAIRAWERAHGGHVSIVAMTASALEGDRDACLNAGMDDYLSKPVQLADLQAAIDRFVGARAVAG
jgi:PAS domain S-box-containing protein